jgi:hypothetical protein
MEKERKQNFKKIRQLTAVLQKRGVRTSMIPLKIPAFAKRQNVIGNGPERHTEKN